MFADYRNEIYRSRKWALDFSTDDVQIEELQDLKSGQAEAAEMLYRKRYTGDLRYETIALVRDNKKQTQKEFCKIVIGTILGGVILGVAIRFRIYPISWISSSDGSTAYFMSGFMDAKYVIAIALLGASIVGISKYKFFKLMFKR